MTSAAVQAIDAPLSNATTFLVCCISPGSEAISTVQDVLSDIDGLVKTVGFRDRWAHLSCTVGIGATVWNALTGRALPRELHPFREISGARHSAIATPGDLLFHLRSDRQDFCFELERLILDALGAAVTTADEVSGFSYFEHRDLLGFVDGTANPIGDDLPRSTLVGDEDPDYAGGSYVTVQKYTHPLAAWNALNTEQQEAIIGRRKFDGVELPDAAAGQKSHKTLTTITDSQGEHDIVRDNMPFGSPGSDEFGTYFIGYSRHLWVIERMLERMFIGDPPGMHDRLLDFSTPRTGTTFFVPTAEFLAALGSPAPAEPAAPAPAPGQRNPDGSLGIGAMRTPTTERASS